MARTINNAFTTQMTLTQTIAEPEPMDILCGKDKNCSAHTGNRRFRALIDINKASYSRATCKNDKMKITKGIVDTLKEEYGSRFIKPAPENGWIEISDSQARDKTSHALRFAAKRLKKRSNTDEDQEDEYSSASCASSYTSNKRPRGNSEDSSSTIASSAATNNNKGRLDFAAEEEDQATWDSLVRRQQAILERLRKQSLDAKEPDEVESFTTFPSVSVITFEGSESTIDETIAWSDEEAEEALDALFKEPLVEI